MGQNLLLVAFEGLDNAGKTRLIGDLAQGFSPILRVEVTKELTTEVGQLIKRKISELDAVAKVLLFAADRHLRCRRDLPRDSDQHCLCLADRWLFSALAYRSAEDGSLREYVRDVNRVFPMPDITFLVDISPEESHRRDGRGEQHTYTQDFLGRVRGWYLRLAREYAMVVVNGMRDYNSVLKEVEERILAELTTRGVTVDTVP